MHLILHTLYYYLLCILTYQYTLLVVLGPMVVNKDGTLSRITNWDVKLPHEQSAILKKLSKRNEERLQVLRQKEGQEMGEGVKMDD
jgi:hypothetical protein